MNKYESIIIVKPNVEIEEIIEKVEDFINKNGKIEKTESLGTKKLAYEIKGFKEGQYVVFYFESETNETLKLDKIYRNTENIIKFITIRVEE